MSATNTVFGFQARRPIVDTSVDDLAVARACLGTYRIVALNQNGRSAFALSKLSGYGNTDNPASNDLKEVSVSV